MAGVYRLSKGFKNCPHLKQIIRNINHRLLRVEPFWEIQLPRPLQDGIDSGNLTRSSKGC
jgi:hypothetical protein